MTPGPVSDSAPGPSDGSPLDTPICIVFSGTEPNLQFVEVETDEGQGLSVGEWGKHCRVTDLSVLVITPRSILKALGIVDDFEVLRCAFCGFEYLGPNPAPREDLEQHIRECPNHPMREVEKENARLHEQFDSYPGAFQAFEDELAQRLDAIRMAHRVGYQSGVGPCVCRYCKPKEKTDGGE